MKSRNLSFAMASALAVMCLAPAGVPLALGQEGPPAAGRGGPPAPGGPGRGRGGPAEAPLPAPRLPNIPYLGANAGKPDFGGKGMWNVPYVTDMAKARGGVEKATDVPFKPEFKKIFDERVETNSKDDPEGHCLPPGIPRMMYTPYPAEILQLPDRIVFIYEGGAHVWRTIWLDGRSHPKDPNPTYLGDSIGHWEGDTLVVDVVGFNDRTWLDFAGHPHTEQLHVIEKYSRPSLQTLHYEATIDDPGAYTAQWTVPMNIRWSKGQELMEYICQENNRDVQHLVGK